MPFQMQKVHCRTVPKALDDKLHGTVNVRGHKRVMKLSGKDDELFGSLAKEDAP